MAARADDQHRYPQVYLQQKKRRRRRKEQVSLYLTAYLIAAALLITAGAVCWKGIQMLCSSMEAALSLLSSQDDPSAGGSGGDHDAPTLSGVHDFTVYQGDTISYMSGITAADETDPSPVIAVDSRAVDLSQPGAYRVVYTATDASGNSSQAAAIVTVLEKRDGYADLETIYAAADEKLAEIIRDNATVKQQVQDIYAWARRSLSYGGHSDRTDWRQTAYGMLTGGKGDCFGYFAVTKLLFERLEIPNQDVRKVKNSSDDSDHFWSLVSLDGGETWYHFDATPRYGDGDDFCLVTDAFLDAYSDSHKGSHNRDKSLYPETP